MEPPSIETFILATPLYEKIAIDQNSIAFLYELFYCDFTVDGYCPGCDSDSTFRTERDQIVTPMEKQKSLLRFESLDPSPLEGWTNNRFYNIKFGCSRDQSHKIMFLIFSTPTYLMKVGQYPSIAESTRLNLKKYKKVLSKEKLDEFNRAIGLIKHGVGIGSFIYLRRIFEDQIEEAHKKNKKNTQWNDTEYKNARMAEKIDLLKHDLPAFLVQHKTLYSILSKAVHELSEQECLAYFDTVKTGIELILDQKIKLNEESEKTSAVAKSIQQLYQDLDEGSGID